MSAWNIEAGRQSPAVGPVSGGLPVRLPAVALAKAGPLRLPAFLSAEALAKAEVSTKAEVLAMERRPQILSYFHLIPLNSRYFHFPAPRGGHAPNTICPQSRPIRGTRDGKIALEFNLPMADTAAVMNKISTAFFTCAAATLALVSLSATAQTPAASDKITLKFVRVDSEETASEDGHGANAMDGDPATFWHTKYSDETPPCPHEIVIELVPPSTISGFTYLPRQDDQVNGTIKDFEFYVSDDGKEFGQPVKKGTLPEGKDKHTVNFDPKKARFIKLRALSEVNGEAWTSAAEIGVVPGKQEAAAPAAPAPGNIKLKFVRADSEETASQDGHGANAVDGDPATFWHTQWTDENPPCPHEIVIELIPPSTIKGFTYLPRQDSEVNGTIKDYEFYLSDDDKSFGQPVKKGTFAEGSEKKTVNFDPKKGRFIKLRALSELNDNAWTSAAEITVIPGD